jgi:replication factor C subunit 3/5
MNISFFDDKPNLDELDFKIDLLKNYKNLTIDEINNLVFYGLPGSGKTTKIYALLCSLFDKKVYDLKNVFFEEDKKKIFYKASIYHIEVDPINLGSDEKLFVQTFLKAYVETRNIGLNISKVILIKNANCLSKQSQMALRKIIEQNSYTSKFIFELSSISNFSIPLLSRFLHIRIKAPSYNQIKECLTNFSFRKNIIISESKIEEIINDSNIIKNTYNLKKIFGYYRYYLTTGKDFKFLYYDKFHEIFNYIIVKKISFVTLQKIRDIVNEMYINLVNLNDLVTYLLNKLINIYSNDHYIIDKILTLAIQTDINIKKGNKDCLHVEYFIISVIDIINNRKCIVI